MWSVIDLQKVCLSAKVHGTIDLVDINENLMGPFLMRGHMPDCQGQPGCDTGTRLAV